MPVDELRYLASFRDSPWRGWLAGFVSAPVLACSLTVATVAVWPDLPGLKTFAHILDNLVLHLAVLAGLGIALLAWLGAPRVVTLISAAGVIAGLTVTAVNHARASLPLADAPAELRVLWFNMLQTNETPPGTLARALIDSPADVIMVAEATPLVPVLEQLDAAFSHRKGCDIARECRIMVLSRLPGVELTLASIGRMTEDRFAMVRLPAAAGHGAPLSIVGLHLNKPWFFGIVETEAAMALWRMRGLDGPVVLMGDFNAAPWSRRLLHFTGPCGFAAPRLAPPTWPAAAGRAGLPIDHVLVREARLVSLAPWGRDLGSNHVGLLAGVSTQDAAPASTIPEACFLPP